MSKEKEMIEDLQIMIKTNEDDLQTFTRKLNTLIKFWQYELKEEKANEH